jgi:hypothetical protein
VGTTLARFLVSSAARGFYGLARQRLARAFTRLGVDVLEHLEVHRRLLGEAGAQRPVDVERGARGVVHLHGGSGVVAVDLQVAALAVDHHVVPHEAGVAVEPPLVGARRAVDDDHRHALDPGAGHRVDEAQRADAARHRHRADAVHAAVAIGGVAGFHLVGVADARDLAVVVHPLQERNDVVARDREQVPHPQLEQALDQVVGNGEGGLGHGVFFSEAAIDGASVFAACLPRLETVLNVLKLRVLQLARTP